MPPAAGDGRLKLRYNRAATGRGRGRGGSAGPLNTRNCTMGVGLAGTADPLGGGCVATLVPSPAQGSLGIRYCPLF